MILDAVVGLFVAGAVLAPTLGRGRRARVATGRLAPRGVRRSARQRVARLVPWMRRSAPVDVQLVVAQVVALIRAGASPAQAWQRAAGVGSDEGGVPMPEALDHVLGRSAGIAVAAASRLAAELGAPLTEVLTDVAATVVEEARAQAERDAAFAGPRSTARVLVWLPVAGVGLGAALGADPLGTAFDGGVGTGSALLGLLLLLAGRRWSAALLDHARRAGATC